MGLRTLNCANCGKNSTNSVLNVKKLHNFDNSYKKTVIFDKITLLANSQLKEVNYDD